MTLIFEYPNKKRQSKCHKPWEFEPGQSVTMVQDQTLCQVVGSWDDMICGSLFKMEVITSEIHTATSVMSHEFNVPDEQKTFMDIILAQAIQVQDVFR